MTTVTMKDAKNRFAELVRQAEDGDTVTVTRNGDPVADIVPHKKKTGGIDWQAGEAYLKKHGADRLFSYIAPDFDDPLPEDFLLKPLPKTRVRKK